MRGLLGFLRLAAIGLPVLFAASAAQSQSGPPTAEELAAQINALKQDYEQRIASLEAQIATLESKSRTAETKGAAPAATIRRSGDNSFNPAIGVVLNSRFVDRSKEEVGLPGFQLGHESERPDKGFSLGHSEVTMSGNIDDKFRGALTLGLGAHDDETEVELEEAYIQTLAGSGMPDGVRLKAGRALWTFGYLNEQHAHADDFADRPLPYRAFLDGAYNDDGLELSVVLPGELYSEIGGGVFRGGDTPFGGSESGREAWSAYARIGGDVGSNSALRLGAYVLDGEAHGRAGGAHAHDDEHAHDDDHDDEHAHEDEEEHDNDNDMAMGDDDHDDHDEHAHSEYFSEGAFTGDTRLFGVDFRYTWAPTGNARDSELILQGEYFRRSETGSYTLQEEHEECDEELPEDHGHKVCETHVEEMVEDLNGDSSGWYAQAVYKFLPQWRAGMRYARLSPPSAAELDNDVSTVSAMLDWTNSEFGRVRFQYNRESFGETRDNQVILQYVMSLGAHSAHSF